MKQAHSAPYRILVIDDEASIHTAYLSILRPASAANTSLMAAEEALFGERPSAKAANRTSFEVDTATQGERGLELLKAAIAEGRPYKMAFVDMRMPPGWNGIETVKNLWNVDPDLEVVISTAYSDTPWDEVVEELGQTHKLLLLRKPFDSAEVWQMADSLSQKRTRDEKACEYQSELAKTNMSLSREVQARQSIEGLLKFDSLTQLPNRVLLYERIEMCIERAKLDPQSQYAVIFIDIDDFKMINDTYGHAMGDFLLVEVANRLKSCVRSMGHSIRTRGDIPARLGGDEFVLLLDNPQSAQNMLSIANRIQELMRQPITLGGRVISSSISLGCAIGTKEHLFPDDALRDADAALYQAKANGKGQICVFDDSIRQSVITRKKLRNDLKSAIHENQIRLVYQPVISLESGIPEGFEALARWWHPTLGVISPTLFIPIAEESGCIHEIGYWVLRESCQQLMVWRQQFPSLTDLSISVNVSTRQLAEHQFAHTLGEILQEIGLPGEYLNVELTESVFIENVAMVCQQLDSIRKLGVKLHLDDFGTGYSSLSTFHTLPVDAIKIDRSFVTNMLLNGQVANIVNAIQQMASNRNLRVIAEGIETKDQLSQLQALGCQSGQGFYLSRPVDSVKAQALLTESERRLLQPIAQWPQSKSA